MIRSLRRSQLRAPRAGVAVQLFFAGCNRLFRENLPDSLPRAFAQAVLGDAILQRVEADDHQSCGGLEQTGCGLQQNSNLVQLAIYVDTKSLKGSGRRMNAVLFHWRGD